MPGYRTAQGKIVDMAQLAAKNEKVRAVGNMNVNARGDIVDSHNRVIQDNTKRVKSSYQKIVSEQKPAKAQTSPSPIVPDNKLKEPELSQEEKEFFDDDEDIIK